MPLDRANAFGQDKSPDEIRAPFDNMVSQPRFGVRIQRLAKEKFPSGSKRVTEMLSVSPIVRCADSESDAVGARLATTVKVAAEVVTEPEGLLTTQR